LRIRSKEQAARKVATGSRRSVGLIVVLLLVSGSCLPAHAANSKHQGDEHIGGALSTTPPLAHLSPALNTKAIDKAMRKVGDWELKRSQPYFAQGWTWGVLYTGFMAASRTLPDRKYRAAMLRMGDKFDWRMEAVAQHARNVADYHVIGQSYLELYQHDRQAKMIQPTQALFDHLMSVPDIPDKPVWWWCDALFMGPPTWARLYRVTGNKAYLDYMNREFWITSNLLYRPKEKLYSRDATFLHKTDKDGNPLFWSRGNGWVLAGIARILEDMPVNYPSRPKYVAQFRQIASRVASLQGPDGLWSSDLLDRKAYPAPEVSGSSLFVFGIAWGIDQGILDRATYLPVVEKGWKGLLSHVYENGRLGAIQPVGAAPGAFPPTSSYVYGVGGFLLAGSELHRLAAQPHSSRLHLSKRTVRRP